MRLTQSGLGMPDRDYYLREDKDIAATREAYKQVPRRHAGASPACSDPARAAAVYALEVSIAQAHWPAAERRDADKTYNPMTLAELDRVSRRNFRGTRISPRPASRATRRAGERARRRRRKVGVPEARGDCSPTTPVAVWRDYLTVHYLHERADYLPNDIDDTDFAFYGTVISGQKEQLPRELRGIHLLDEQMGEALGKLYCAQILPARKPRRRAASWSRIC